MRNCYRVARLSSLTHEHGARVGYRLRVYTAAGRRSIWLGQLSKTQAIGTQRHVDEIIAAQTAALPIPRPTAAWLRSISPELRHKLRAITGAAKTVADVCDEYLDARSPEVAESTLATIAGSLTKLTDAMGSALIANVTADELGHAIASIDVGKSTAGKHAKHWRQLFTWAVSRDYLAESPAGQLSTAVGVRTKQFIAAETVHRILASIECPELRAVVLLSRFGGLRIPSEIYTFHRDAIDTANQRITITDTKRKRTRTIPLFPELEPLATYPEMFPTFRDLSPAGITARFQAAIIAAGLKPWPALWHSMRATRETELIESFGLKAACEWIGNSESVALKSYSLIPDNVWARATAPHL